MFRMKKGYLSILVLVLAFVIFAQTAKAEFFEWKSDVTGTIWVTADLTISGNTLTIELANISTTPTTYPVDVFSSFYFDFVNTNGDSMYPTLNGLVSATGDLYRTVLGGADVLLGTDLLTINDPTILNPTPAQQAPWWIAKDMEQSQYPLLGYGIGAVGNNYLTPNNFPQMDGDNGGIVQNDNIESSNFTGKGNTPLVKDMATFVLEFDDDLEGLDIGLVAFGFGSDPHSLHVVPVPGAVLLGLLGLGVVGIKLRKFA